MASDHNRFARREVTPTLNQELMRHPLLSAMLHMFLSGLFVVLGPCNLSVNAARCWPILAVSARSKVG